MNRTTQIAIIIVFSLLILSGTVFAATRRPRPSSELPPQNTEPQPNTTNTNSVFDEPNTDGQSDTNNPFDTPTTQPTAPNSNPFTGPVSSPKQYADQLAAALQASDGGSSLNTVLTEIVELDGQMYRTIAQEWNKTYLNKGGFWSFANWKTIHEELESYACKAALSTIVVNCELKNTVAANFRQFSS